MRHYFGWFQSMGYAAMGCGVIVDIEPGGDWKDLYKRAAAAVHARNICCTAFDSDVDAIFRVPSAFATIPDDAMAQYFLERCPTAAPGGPMLRAPGWWITWKRDAAMLAASSTEGQQR